MIEKKLPAEISEYKSKLVFGLSTRQVIAIAGALLVCVPVGLFGRKYLSTDILMWIEMILVVPFAGWGFLKFHDMRFEDFMKAYLSMTFLPQKRVYEDIDYNLFHQLHEEILEEEIIRQRIESGEYEMKGDEE